VRALTLRRLAPDETPPAKQLVVAELPIFLIEAALIAVLLAVAVPSLPQAPGWTVPATLAAAAAGLLALRMAAMRMGDRSAGAGLRLLGDRRRRGAVVALLVAVTALGVVRAWLILLGFGLPHDLASASLAFVSLGVFGLLPIGPGSTPVALLAVAGGADPTAAIAAGIAVTGTSWAGVGAYASAGAALWAARSWWPSGLSPDPPIPTAPRRRTPAPGADSLHPDRSRYLGDRESAPGLASDAETRARIGVPGLTRSASRVDQPKWRAASPSPSSGL
jgi:hypothetical protein